MTEPVVVRVEWEDSSLPRSGWEWIEDAPTPKPVRCESVGWLVAESEAALLLAPTLGYDGEDRQMAGALTIARRQVVRVTYLCALACPGPGSEPMQPPISPALVYPPP